MSDGDAIDVEELQRRFLECTDSMFSEGLVDNGFKILMGAWEEEGHPAYSINMLRLFWQLCEDYLRDLEDELAKPNRAVDFDKLLAIATQTRYSCFCVGARRFQDTCDLFYNHYLAADVEGCRRCLPQLRAEFERARTKFETVRDLGVQILDAGASIPEII